MESIGSVRARLDDLERRIGRKATTDDGHEYRAFENPSTDAHRTRQLMIAYAQQYGGRLGPVIHPITGLESEQAKAKIAKSQQWLTDFCAAMEAGDEQEASRLAGGEVRIVDGMTSDGDR